MSSTYNLEPPPTAKVLLQTSAGDIELELFAKQTPLTSRNFLQHCLDDYYDNTLFHRLVPGFVLQGGDPTGTGDGGESIYPDGPFADEFHSRLKFNRRGLLGMANTGRKDDNGSQFFITLGKTEELTNKNTMFGRVVGDTIYNVIKMGEAELMEAEGSERPLYPTKIIGTEVLLNPFADMVKRELKPKAIAVSTKAPEKKGKKRGGKVLLSFGGDDGEESAEPLAKKAKFNTRLLADSEVVSRPKPTDASGDRKEKSVRKRPSRSPTPPPVAPKVPAEPKVQLPLPNEEGSESDTSSSPEPESRKRGTTAVDKLNAEIAATKATMRRGVPQALAEPVQKKSALEEMIPETAIRGRKRKQGKRDTSAADDAALKMLQAFQAKLDKAPKQEEQSRPLEVDGQDDKPDASEDEKAAAGDDDEAELCDLHFIANCQSCKAWDKEGPDDEPDDPNDKSWMSHALVFGKDRLGKDLSWKKQNEDGLMTIDPREKGRDLKEESREKKRDKGSSRAWDRDRDRDKARDRDREHDRYRDRDRDRTQNRHRDTDRTRDRDRYRDHDRRDRRH